MKKVLFSFGLLLISLNSFTRIAENDKNINGCYTNNCVTVLCPNNITVECIEEFMQDANDAAANSTCSTIQNQWITQPTQSGLPNCPGTTYTFTYKAVDSNGNVGCCDQIVTIGNTAPTITVPPGTIVECYSDIMVYPTDATVTTSCGEVLGVTIYPPVLNGELDCPGTTYTFTYRVKDQCGREATADRVFTNGDNTAPIVQAPDDTTCECIGGVTPNPNNAMVVTECTLGYTATVSGPMQVGPTDCPGTTYTFTYSAFDDCGRLGEDQQIYTIINGPPILSDCPEHCLTLNCNDQHEQIIQAWLATVTATTSCGVPLSVSNDYDPNSQGVCIYNGMTTVTWSATDECGRTTTCTGEIVITDTDAPRIVNDAQDQFKVCNYNTPGDFDDWVAARGNAIAIDDCWEGDLNWITDPPNPVWNIGNCGEIEVTFIATDGCGNSNSTTAKFIAQDPIAPSIFQQPSDMTIECPDTDDAFGDWLASYGGAIATDNCGDVNWSTNPENPELSDDCGETGSVTVVFIADDGCGNFIETNPATFAVVDNASPLFTFIPASEIISCDKDPVFGTPTATDNCNGVTISHEDLQSGDGCMGSFTRTWTAEDACGNTSMASQTLNYEDVEAPVFTFIPSNETIGCGEDPIFGTPTATDNCNGVTISHEDSQSGDGCMGSFIRTWTAEDACGNTSMATQVLNYADTEAPEFTFIPGNEAIGCGEDPVFGIPTATDNCNGVTISHEDSQSGDGCIGSFTRTWTAVDACGNTSTAFQTLNYEDTEAPEFTFIPGNEAIGCGEGPVFGIPIATDNCNGVTISHEDSQSGDDCIGSFTRTWTAADACGNTSTASQTLNYEDTEAPVFTFIPGNETIGCGEAPVFGTPTATDNCNGVTINHEDSQSGDACIGSFTRTWTATDACGNTSTATQTLNYEDTEAPVFTFIPDSETIGCGEDPVFGTPTAIDNCIGVTISHEDSQSGDACMGSFTRTWTAVDVCGNASMASQTLSFQDTEVPLFTVTASNQIPCSDDPVFGVFFATDLCNEVTITHVDSQNGDDCVGSYTRTWTAVDDCGNAVSASQTLSYADTDPPFFTFIPPGGIIACDEIPVFGTPIAIDNCNGVTISHLDSQTGDNCNGSYIRTWTATDDCGNSSTASQILSYQDVEPPEIMCQSDTTIQCMDSILIAPPIVSDNCDLDVEITYTEVIDSMNICTIVITRTWKASDDCGNIDSCIQIITLLDTIPPSIICPPDTTIGNCDLPFPIVSPVITDNCDTNVIVTYVEDTIITQPCGLVFNRTWIAEDFCGNIDSCTQVITIPSFCDDTLSQINHPYLGYATATCYSGVDPNGYVLSRMDIRKHPQAPIDSNWDPTDTPPLNMYHGPTNNWKVDSLGEVFGIALDLEGNIYVASTAIYRRPYAGPDSTPLPTWGIGGLNPSIFKIDINGNISIFNTSVLPNQIDPDSCTTSSDSTWCHKPAFGNIAYNSKHKVLYVSNFEDGKIYTLDESGTVITASTFDHLNPDNGDPGLVPVGERVFGLGYNLYQNKLYYSVWNNDPYNNIHNNSPDIPNRNEVWCVNIDCNGYITGDSSKVLTVGSAPISDIAFTVNGDNMLIAERSFAGNYDFYVSAHSSRVREYKLNPSGNWIMEPINKYGIGVFSMANSAGGLDYTYNDSLLIACDSTVLATSDAIHFGSPYPDVIYGIQGLPASGGSILNSFIIDLDGITSGPGVFDKYFMGDVESYRDPCCGAPSSVCTLNAETQGDTTICVGEKVDLNTFITGAVSTPTCSWYPADSLSDANSCNPDFASSQPGNYNFQVTVTTDNCVAIDVVSITVVSCDDCCVDPLEFETQVDSGFVSIIDCYTIDVMPNALDNCHQVTWLWGDGTSSDTLTENTPATHNFEESGIYDICMVVEELDDNGVTCFIQENCQTIEIDCFCSPYISNCPNCPSGFIPNDMIINGDFELGDFGPFIPVSCGCEPGTFCISNDATNKCSSLNPVRSPSCFGNYMIIENGNNGIVWLQDVFVEEGINYDFSFNFHPLLSGMPDIDIPPTLDVEIGGEVILSGITSDQPIWNSICGSWQALQTGLFSIAIIQTSGDNQADYGIDDIQFFSECVEGFQIPPGITETINTFNDEKSDFEEIVSSTYGISKDNAINIYPNPTTSKVTILFNSENATEVKLIEIFDLHGRRVFSKPLSESNSIFEVDLGHMLSGLYFLNVTIEDKVYIKKIVKM